MSETLLDARGLNCPLPVLKARKAMKSMTNGELLKVMATDPASVIDFRAFCLTTGHELVEATQDGEVFVFVIRHVDKADTDGADTEQADADKS